MPARTCFQNQMAALIARTRSMTLRDPHTISSFFEGDVAGDWENHEPRSATLRGPLEISSVFGGVFAGDW